MENFLYILDRTAITIAALQVGAVLALSVFILIFYSRHRSMFHIALVATSYIILTALVAGAVIFQIFHSSRTRAIGIVLTLIAFALGDISLWIVWQNRGEVQEMKELTLINERLDREAARLANLEKHFANEPHEVTLAPSEVVKVAIVEAPEELPSKP